jgi:hypothetical protein
MIYSWHATTLNKDSASQVLMATPTHHITIPITPSGITILQFHLQKRFINAKSLISLCNKRKR